MGKSAFAKLPGETRKVFALISEQMFGATDFRQVWTQSTNSQAEGYHWEHMQKV